jgi:hypothetical protein
VDDMETALSRLPLRTEYGVNLRGTVQVEGIVTPVLN